MLAGLNKSCRKSHTYDQATNPSFFAFSKSFSRRSIRALKRTSPAASSRREDLIRDIRRGRMPQYDRVAKILDVLSMKIEVVDKHMSIAQYKTGFNSDNPTIVVSPEIASALDLSKDASLGDVLKAIKALLATQLNDAARWTALETEIKALREAIQKLTPDNHS